MQRLIEENEVLVEEIRELEIKLVETQKDSVKQTNVIKVNRGNKKGAGKQGRGFGVSTGKAKTYAKTKQLFNVFLSGDENAIEEGQRFLEKYKKQRKKYNLNSVDGLGETLLIHACRKGDLTLVNFLMKNGASINQQDLEGETALMVAAKLDAYDISQALLDRMSEKKILKRGIDLVLERSRKTALMQAAEKGHVRIVSLLLEYGANPEKIDLDGKSAKDLAKENKHKKVAKAISAVSKSKKSGRSNATKPAAGDEEEDDDEEYDELALDDDISDDDSDDSDLEDVRADGEPLVTYENDESMASLLKTNNELKTKKLRLIAEIESAEKKRAPDEWDQIRNLNKEEREQLLMNDQRPEKVKQQIKEFHDLVVADKWEKFEDKFLLNKNVKIGIDVKDSFGETALMKACRQGNVDSVEMLITYRAKVDIRDGNGDTALMIAALHNKIECAERVLDAGASPNHHTKHKRHTALMHASIRGHAEMVELLISRGANVTLADSHGKLARELCPFDDVKQILAKAEEKIKQTRYSTDPTILT